MAWPRKRISTRFAGSLSEDRIRSIVRFFAQKQHEPHFEDFDARPWTIEGRQPIDDRIIERTALLAPSLLLMLVPKMPMDLMRAVNAIVSGAVQCQLAMQQPRVRPTKKQFSRSVLRSRALVAELQEAAAPIQFALDELFSDITRAAGGASLLSPGLRLIEMIDLMLELLEEDIHAEGEAGKYLAKRSSHPKPKLNAVDYTAYISRRFRGPRLVTTPGSDFSQFCSLLYEIATGQRDESMQGAIIAYAMGERPSVVIGPHEEENFDAEERDMWAIRYHAHRGGVAAKIARKYMDDHARLKFLVHLGEAQAAEVKSYVARRERRLRATLGEGR